MPPIPAESDAVETDRPGIEDSFGKSIILIVILMGVQRAIGFLRSFYVCGVMSAEEVGQWDLCFNFLSLVAPLAVLGIPGSFGRYLARFEKEGRERELLYRTLIACGTLTGLASLAILAAQPWISQHFFADGISNELMAMLAIGLPAVVFLNFSTCWFAGRRQNRLVFRIQFLQTIFFAFTCLVSFTLLRGNAETVVACYLISCLGASLLGLAYLFRRSDFDASSLSTEVTDSQSPPNSIWNKLLPFAFWVWISNALMNLFSVCDRVLLVNYLTDSADQIQFLIGQYHTACLFPALLMTLGAMIASTGMPYLSKDWETGDRVAVTSRLSRMVIGVGVICLAASTAIQLAAPALFDGLWKGKYSLGETLLPLTLSYCSLAAMTLVAQKFFWCLEKTWLSGLFLLVGLATNFFAGRWLVDSMGISGVVLSTLIAHSIVLLGVLAVSHLGGWKLQPGVIYLVACIICSSFGLAPTITALCATVILTLGTSRLFSSEEKQQVFDRVRRFLRKPVPRST